MSILDTILDKAKAATNGHKPADVPVTYTPNANLRQDDSVSAPPFPMDAYPERIRRIIDECQQFMCYPSDLTAASILAATALAIGRTHRLYYQGEWRESACMYMAIVAPPGTAKSHPLKFALDPITQRNKEAIREYSQAQKQLADAGEVTENLKDRQCLFSDFTIEALTRAVQKNARGVGVYIDELRAWFQNFNRYNSGSEQEFWLQNWSGMSMGITRMTKKAWLDWPAISVVGTIQPGLLEDIGKGGRNQNGFTERILFCFPDTVPVLKLRKRVERSDTSAIMQKNYKPIINVLLDKQLLVDGRGEQDDEPYELFLEPSADDYVTDYINDLKTRMEEIDNEFIRNVYSKMQTYTLRFCLILNRLDYACAYQENRDFPAQDDLTVTRDQAFRASMLTEYFLQHSMKANNAVNAQTPLEKLPKNLRLFYKALPMGEIFNTSKAEQVAEKFQISRAALFRMLNETDHTKKLFQKIRHGDYERLYA